jgi:hypothetical protein
MGGPKNVHSIFYVPAFEKVGADRFCCRVGQCCWKRSCFCCCGCASCQGVVLFVLANNAVDWCWFVRRRGRGGDMNRRGLLLKATLGRNPQLLLNPLLLALLLLLLGSPLWNPLSTLIRLATRMWMPIMWILTLIRLSKWSYLSCNYKKHMWATVLQNQYV